MKVAVLGTGSAGNAVLLESGPTRLLVDVGFSGAELSRRLAALDVDPESIDAVVVTHEHRDHTKGIGVAARRWGWPVYLSEATARSCSDLWNGTEERRPLPRLKATQIGELEVRPFVTCHDAVDPLAVTVRAVSTGLEVGVAYDLGRATVPVRAALAGCHFLLLEANHDERLLRAAPYPWSVKRRIGGSRGHLSNRLAAELAAELTHPELVGVLLTHLSQECNEPARAYDAVHGALLRAGFRGVLGVALQNAPSSIFDVDALLRRQKRREPQIELFAPDGRGP